MDAALLCPPLVLIEWLDSGQPVPGWQWLEALEPRQPHLCVSVGFLVQDDASAKVLAPNLGASNGGGGWDQASELPSRLLRSNARSPSPLLPILWLQAALLDLLGRSPPDRRPPPRPLPNLYKTPQSGCNLFASWRSGRQTGSRSG